MQKDARTHSKYATLILWQLQMRQGQVPDYILEMAVAALQHGVSAESLVALLNGNVSDSGVDITPYKDLGGCLSRLTEEERRIGGSLTETIRVCILLLPAYSI